MNTATLPIGAAQSARRDIQTISLIGLAHGTSHFFHMLLPPLFPVFMREFGLSYSELGLLVTLFFVISGVGQALSGFLVDRTGARPILFLALGCFVLASAAAGTAQGFAGLALAAALAGLGNSPFHPVDFTILNKRVSQARLGHAFSVHGISGNIGWALAPVLLLWIYEGTGGQWRLGYAATAAWALLVMLLLALKRDAIDDSQGEWTHQKAGAAAVPDEHPMAFLRLPSVWLCFSFFFFTTAALTAIQSFASPALNAMYGLDLTVTKWVVTGYMVAGAVGMVLGGFLVARSQQLERNIAWAMTGAAVLLALTGSGWLPGGLALLAATCAGFGTGLAGPSRDMLIKKAAPPGATGRVYGTVYSGLDTGFAVAAPIFGALMDRHWNNAVFLGAALALMAGIGAASLVRRG
ncbi:MFS transporter [Roseateles depolymerans]|uniref:Putative transmembrane transport protein n=1 Tax=Roseateles depolymerans TaxID=76731 RepID=A0A0U3E3U2_9BURK|nr:MFS transporter [Roseateles depolymerans]ALV07877.1 Putative transmembrane transport protein [Roseateles depolymerans]REG21902.1 sugar phosphate permease [Roseateles depolymerans]